MRDEQDLVFGVGGSLHLDVPEGRPSSVTSVAVYEMHDTDDSTAVEATTGSASVDAVDTTFDAASGKSQANPKLLNVAATTGIVAGRQYLATNAAGEREWIEVVGITSGASVTSRSPLYNDYAISDTLEGTRISISVDSTWAETANNVSPPREGQPYYRVLWTYVVSGTTYRRYSYFDLVRSAGQHNVTPADMGGRYPGWLDRLPHDAQDDRGRRLIEEAYQEVKLDFLAAGLEDAAQRGQDTLDRLVMYKARLIAEDNRATLTLDTTGLEIAQAAWERVWNAIMGDPSRTKIAMARDQGGSASPVRPLPITVR